MNVVVARWKMLDERFSRLARREKVLVAGAALFGVLMVGNSLLVEPQMKAAKGAKRGIEQASGEIGALGSQLAGLREQLKADPDAGAKAELSALKAKIEERSRSINSQQSTLVPPDRMNTLLETLLRRHPALRLVSLKSLPPVSLLPAVKDAKDGKPSAREFDLYRHGVEVRVSGSYADLYAYLLSLEKHEQKLLWGEVRLLVEEYPRAQLTIVVHTLSSDQAWLKI